MDMIIDWLISVEETAAGLYEKGADLFRGDETLADLLTRLAGDENNHADALRRIRDYAAAHGIHPPPDITPDPDCTARIEKPLQGALEAVRQGALDKKALLEAVVAAEHSEWNDIFLYVVRSFAGYDREFEYLAAAVQAHESRIQAYLDTLAPDAAPNGDLKDLPPVWQPRFLVVEDTPVVLQLYTDLLSGEGDVHTAVNGAEALDQVQRHVYSVIISDVDMPEMDGITFYTKAVAHDQRLKDRFLFCSGALTASGKTFFREHGIPYFQKPVGITDLLSSVKSIAARADETL